MRRPADPTRLRHALAAARKAQEFSRGMTFEEFRQDERTASAVIHQLQIVGEALNGVSPDFQVAHSEIAWREAVSMRHHLIHSYFKTDLAIVGRTVTDDLTQLLLDLEQALGEAKA